MKKFFAVILICIASVAGAAGVITPHFSDIVTKGPWVDVRAHFIFGDNTDVTSKINALFQSLDNNTGYKIYFPKGRYRLTGNIALFGKNQVEIYGDGMGQTIFDGTGIVYGQNGQSWGCTDVATKPDIGICGTITISSAKGGTQRATWPYTWTGEIWNTYIHDFTVINARHDEHYPASPELDYNHSIIPHNAFNFTMERVEVIGGGPGEIVMPVGEGNNHEFIKNYIHVPASMEKSAGMGAINHNTMQVNNILIDRNLFENVSGGVYAGGSNLIITNNRCDNVTAACVGVGEPNYVDGHSASGIVVANNVSRGGGMLGETGTRTYPWGNGVSGTYFTGFYWGGRSEARLNKDIDGVAIFANNTVLDSWGCTESFAFQANGGGVHFIGNHIGGIIDDNVCTFKNSVAYFISAGGASPYGTLFDNVSVRLSNNVLDITAGRRRNAYPYGVLIAPGDNTSYIFSGNYWHQNAGDSALSYNGNPPATTKISFDGDVFVGGLINLYEASAYNASQELDYVPIYGSTKGGYPPVATDWGGLSTSFSKQLRTRGLDNVATPTVKGMSIVAVSYTNSVTVTNLLNAVEGQEVTIICESDSKMTIVDTGYFALNGNFTCPQKAALRLVYHAGSWWELGRSLN